MRKFKSRKRGKKFHKKPSKYVSMPIGGTRL